MLLLALFILIVILGIYGKKTGWGDYITALFKLTVGVSVVVLLLMASSHKYYAYKTKEYYKLKEDEHVVRLINSKGDISEKDKGKLAVTLFKVMSMEHELFLAKYFNNTLLEIFVPDKFARLDYLSERLKN